MNAPLIDMQGVYFGYGPDHPVFHDLRFELREGERIALTGANGAGKTTLLHLMVGLAQPQRGTIDILGARRRSERDFVEVRKQVGLLFQDSDSQLFCPTVFDDVAFGPLNLGKSLEEARAIVTATLDSLGLSALRDRVTYQLSHGQKRLVALATILAMRPRVLLLDEPTNGLDSVHEARLIEILRDRPEEMVIVSHNAPFIDRVATCRMQLERGCIHNGI